MTAKEPRLKPLIGMDTDELRRLVMEKSQPAYRGNQAAQWIYGSGVHLIDEMTNLPGEFATSLKSEYTVGRSLVAARQQSRDGTFKLLLQFTDGQTVETVGIPYGDRFSCCVSTQVGCVVGCTFCATGKSGFTRNLEAGEIINQVLSVQEVMQQPNPGSMNQRQRVDHVVLMGMGEPLLNYNASLKALHLMNDELGIGARNLTISTSGVVPGIQKLAGEKLQVTLAVSLHAADDQLRHKLMPGTAKWSVEEIISASRNYATMTGRRVTVEYCLLGGVNDSAGQAAELAALLKNWLCHVNLIPHNSMDGIPYRAPSTSSTRTFTMVLQDAGIEITQRVQRGSDIKAACGQLRGSLSEIQIPNGTATLQG